MGRRTTEVEGQRRGADLRCRLAREAASEVYDIGRVPSSALTPSGEEPKKGGG
jgi:hypothetical protein